MTLAKERWQIKVNGIVQGVGFRPFVCRLAREARLAGFVRNTGAGVVIEVEGEPGSLRAFVADLERQAPPAATIAALSSSLVPVRLEFGFGIRSSGPAGSATAWVAPDLAMCDDCLAELFDPADRRFLYPFINCTNCGPRYTIQENIPYDRSRTVMQRFTMCAACRAEYDNPQDRRFHAQPNACHDCGPQAALTDGEGKVLAARRQAVVEAARLLGQGGIVAVKGLGGFHLAVDAANNEAVLRLRRRKGRAAKALAVMVPSLERARQICDLREDEKNILLSPQRPIVLAPKKEASGLAAAVAPDNDRFGVMLPYTPLHHLLFHSGLETLVMTSANLSGEPLCTGNAEAFERLAGLADFFLIHDRDILLCNDDSVVCHAAGETRLIRRSRGYAPRPLVVRKSGPAVLGVGAELKNTVCYLREEQAFVSQHLGDLKNLGAFALFTKTLEHLGRILEIAPELIAHDLHPGYRATQWAREREGPRLAVQHHHAHLAACLAENRHEGPALGFILDGAGHGGDGTIWGGEVLVGDCRAFRRYASFEPMPLPGGDAAVAEPWRTATAYLDKAFDGKPPDLPFLVRHSVEPLLEMIAKGVNTPQTSSCGRLFDAVAAMCGGRQKIRYEGQAAIEFMEAGNGLEGPSFSGDIVEENGMVRMPVKAIVRSVAEAVRQGTAVSRISRRFHYTLVELLGEVACRAAKETGIRVAAFSGGVFQNRVLLAGMMEKLHKAGFTVLTQSELPPNDGCISFGQAVVGRQYLARR